MKLKADKMTNGKTKEVYAKKGEAVSLINDLGNVLLVESKKGVKFSVRREEVI